MEWISVKDRLPDYDVRVIWYYEDGNMYIEALDKDGNPWIDGGEWMGEKLAPATHWQNLPQPPKDNQ